MLAACLVGAAGVHVAERDDILARDVAEVVRPLPCDADHGDVEPLVRRALFLLAVQRRRARHARQGSRLTQKATAIDSAGHNAPLSIRSRSAGNAPTPPAARLSHAAAR